jgi:hypothetical protein
MGKVDLEGGDGGDALIRGLSEAAEKQKAKEHEKKTAVEGKEG